MDIQIDSREKPSAIKRIVEEFDKQGVNHFKSKLLVGDYMNLDNPRLIIDRKQDLQELYGNVCKEHERFRRELLKAIQANIQLIILVEHGDFIQTLEDVYFFYQPEIERTKWKTVKENGKNRKVKIPYIQKPIKGQSLYRSMCTIQQRYNVRFEFCTKEETGKKIIELLRTGHDK